MDYGKQHKQTEERSNKRSAVSWYACNIFVGKEPSCHYKLGELLKTG